MSVPDGLQSNLSSAANLVKILVAMQRKTWWDGKVTWDVAMRTVQCAYLWGSASASLGKGASKTKKKQFNQKCVKCRINE